jgi:hypothetical protein
MDADQPGAVLVEKVGYVERELDDRVPTWVLAPLMLICTGEAGAMGSGIQSAFAQTEPAVCVAAVVP